MANYPGTNTWMNPDNQIPSWLGGVASGLGGLAGGIFGLNKDNVNPADAGQNYLNQIPGAVAPYYNPYIQQGQKSGESNAGIYGEMANNPNDYYNKLASGYKESPGYQYKLNQALQGITNAQAAGGMAGTQQHQQLSAETANGIASQDFNNYLNHVMGINQSGIQGQENATTRGYNASTGYGNIIGTNLAQQGGLAFKGQAGQNQSDQSNWGNIFSSIGTILPWLFA